MAIDFNEIFEMNIPFVQAELVRSNRISGTIKQAYTALIFGQKTALGTASTNEILSVFSANEAKTKFGSTSMLAHAVSRYYDVNKSVELKVIALEDEGTGTEAEASLSLSGTATSTGTLAFYVNGKAYKVAVSISDTAAEIATVLASKIVEDEEAQFTVSDDTSGTLTFTAVHKGSYGNTLKAMINYNEDDLTPAGITPIVVDFAGGAGDPDLTDVITILEDNQFNLIAQPYTDNASLTSIDIALTDNFKDTSMLDGFCVVGVNDSVTNLTTKADVYSVSPFITILDNYSAFSTGLEQAASAIGRIGDIAQSSPASGFLNEELVGILPLKQRKRTERNVLAGNGIATNLVNGNKLQLERTVTTLQKDSNGILIDIDYRDLRVFLSISYIRYTFIVRMSQFQGYKITDDDAVTGAGAKIITPNIYKQNLILNYTQLVSDAICEDIETYEDTVIVERDGNRINSSMYVNVVNVLLQQAMKINYAV